MTALASHHEKRLALELGFYDADPAPAAIAMHGRVSTAMVAWVDIAGRWYTVPSLYRGPATCPHCKADLRQPNAIARLNGQSCGQSLAFWDCANCGHILDETEIG